VVGADGAVAAWGVGMGVRMISKMCVKSDFPYNGGGLKCQFGDLRGF
jgi:hypothetical protein